MWVRVCAGERNHRLSGAQQGRPAYPGESEFLKGNSARNTGTVSPDKRKPGLPRVQQSDSVQSLRWQMRSVTFREGLSHLHEMEDEK